VNSFIDLTFSFLRFWLARVIAVKKFVTLYYNSCGIFLRN